MIPGGLQALNRQPAHSQRSTSSTEDSSNHPPPPPRASPHPVTISGTKVVQCNQRMYSWTVLPVVSSTAPHPLFFPSLLRLSKKKSARNFSNPQPTFARSPKPAKLSDEPNQILLLERPIVVHQPIIEDSITRLTPSMLMPYPCP